MPAEYCGTKLNCPECQEPFIVDSPAVPAQPPEAFVPQNGASNGHHDVDLVPPPSPPTRRTPVVSAAPPPSPRAEPPPSPRAAPPPAGNAPPNVPPKTPVVTPAVAAKPRTPKPAPAAASGFLAPPPPAVPSPPPRKGPKKPDYVAEAEAYDKEVVKIYGAPSAVKKLNNARGGSSVTWACIKILFTVACIIVVVLLKTGGWRHITERWTSSSRVNKSSPPPEITVTSRYSDSEAERRLKQTMQEKFSEVPLRRHPIIIGRVTLRDGRGSARRGTAVLSWGPISCTVDFTAKIEHSGGLVLAVGYEIPQSEIERFSRAVNRAIESE